MTAEMMKECCGSDGLQDFRRVKAFMQKCGKKGFANDGRRRMRQFCDEPGRSDAEKMKTFMEGVVASSERISRCAHERMLVAGNRKKRKQERAR